MKKSILLFMLLSFISIYGQSLTQRDIDSALDAAYKKADELIFGHIETARYDTLQKGDLVWIFDSQDSGYGRIATVVSDHFGKDYFGNNNQCLIRFPESGNGCRGIMLHSIIKIHNKKELDNYLRIEKKYRKHRTE